MCRAFPGSDYYEGSVAIGVSPRRQSRVPLTLGFGSARVHIMGINVESLVTIIWLQLLDALFTGLMLAAVIVFVLRFLKVRGVTFKFEVEGRDQDRDD